MNDHSKVGYSFKEKRVFTERKLKKMAHDCGDMNYIHHDNESAKRTRFSGIIASGSAVSAIFSALIPTHFSNLSPMLGLEMSFKFLAPIRPNVELSMGWSVSKVIEKTKMELIIDLDGEVLDIEEKVLVVGSAKILLLPQL